MGEFGGAVDEAFRLQRERMLDIAFGTSRPLAGLDTAVSAPTTVADTIEKMDMMDMSAIAADMRFAINPSAGLKVSDVLGEYKPAASLVQEYAPASRALNIDELTPFWRDALNYPLGQYMSNLSAVDTGVVASSWKPVLARQPWVPETSFVARMPVAEQKLYSAIRPEILSVAGQLDQASQLPLQNILVDYMGTSFELDLDFYLDLDAPPSDELRLPALPLHSRVILKKVVVWLADRPEKVELLGVVVGDVAGTGMGLMIDGGAAGTLIGSGAGSGLGFTLSKGLVVIVKRCRDRL